MSMHSVLQQHARYAQTGPNMLHYRLGSYIGKVVSSSGVFVGSLCIVYQEERVPSKDDVKLLRIYRLRHRSRGKT